MSTFHFPGLPAGRLDTLDRVLAGPAARPWRAAQEEEAIVQEREAAWAQLDAEIQKGIDDIEAGRTEPLEVVGARLRKKYQAMAAKSAA